MSVTIETGKDKSSHAGVDDPGLQACLLERKLRTDDEGFIRWQNDNPRHPRNWAPGAKAYNTAVILLLGFITSAVGTAGTAAAQEMQTDFHVELSISLLCLTLTYLIGQGIGGIFFPPYSEVFGRKTLYILSTLVYAIFRRSRHRCIPCRQSSLPGSCPVCHPPSQPSWLPEASKTSTTCESGFG